ncbi:MAG: glycosyl hydrolase family 18 protein [Bryobacteraceae bacterium]
MRSALIAIALSAGLVSAPGGDAPRAPLAQFYYVDDTAAYQSLEQNSGSIGVLSPAWIVVGADGAIKTTIDARVARLAAERGIALMPIVMNGDFEVAVLRAVLRDDASRSALAGKLARLALAEGFQGLQLDFENLEASDREPYADLASRLGEELHRYGKQLSVAVASPVYSIGAVDAKPASWTPTPRSEGFDYARLASASDFLTLMAYDQYATADTPGPVAGIAWVEACIRTVLETVPASKIMLGLPLYHRHWAGTRVTTGPWAEAQAEAMRADAPPVWSPLHEEPSIRFDRDRVSHVIWFHDAASLARRMELMRRYRLRGFSAWRLGQEDPAVWPRVFERKGDPAWP